MADRTIAILGFHKIGPTPPNGWESWFYVSEPTFTRYLEELRADRWDVIDVPRFLRGLREPETLPRRSALVTFDDGYRSMREIMLPALRRLDMPGVLFVPTDYVGGRNTFDDGVEPDEPMCDWDDLRELARQGVSIQSHAASHRPFSELTHDERERELTTSKAVLEERLGTPVDVLAFPYGDSGPVDGLPLLQKTGYRAALLYGGGPVRLPISEPYRLQRLAIGPDTDLQAALAGLT